MGNTKTFCNPMNLNYEYRMYGADSPICIEGADPVVVLFEDEYYLFSSVTNGYWVSDDMHDWEFISCSKEQFSAMRGYAPALMVLDGYVYFHQGEFDRRLYRNKTPRNPNTWELVTDNCYVGHDPFLYYDKDEDRIWASYGCGPIHSEYIKVVELDRHTFEQKGEVYNCIFGDEKNRGWERTGDNHTVEPKGWMSGGYTEGSQILKHNGKWYLIYSGFSLHKNYANGVYVSDKPTGPYKYATNNPISHKNTGFVGGAGHGCFFEDKFGNWWNVTCSTYGINHLFERRLNLFPAGFDDDGMLYVNTTLADYPIALPNENRNHLKQNTPYMLLSKNCKVLASSIETSMPENPRAGEGLKTSEVSDSRYIHKPEFVIDEDIRTFWAASDRNEEQWLKLDIESVCDVKAIQLNIHTYNLKTNDEGEKYYEYVIEGSVDDENYTVILDNRGKKKFNPHELIETDLKARYIRVTFYHIAGDGFAAVSGFRIFGINNNIELPKLVEGVYAVRDETDARNCTVKWKKSENADGYLVRYGVAEEKLYNQYQVYKEEVEVRTLTKGTSYFFRVDAFNGRGITEGQKIILLP